MRHEWKKEKKGQPKAQHFLCTLIHKGVRGCYFDDTVIKI